MPAHLKLRIELERGHLGPGRSSCSNTSQPGSLAAAARAMKMSYKRAWELLAATNEMFTEPVSVSLPGRNMGGSTQLTPFGERVIALYRAVERRAAHATTCRGAARAQRGEPPATPNRSSTRRRGNGLSPGVSSIAARDRECAGIERHRFDQAPHAHARPRARAGPPIRA